MPGGLCASNQHCPQRFVPAQHVRDAAEGLHLAAGLAFSEVLDGKDRLDAPDVILQEELVRTWLLAGHGNHND